MTWLDRIREDRAKVAALRGGVVATDAGAMAVARLLDTSWRNEANALLQSLSPEDRARRAGLAYGEGLLAAASGATDEAIAWLTRAQSALGAGDIALGARITLELGYIYSAHTRPHVAEAVLAWGRGLSAGVARVAADVIHLDALLHTLRGDHAKARVLYHQAVASSSDALTPWSRVLALSNLAVSLTHTDPQESAHLSGLALATHRADQLHPRAEAAMRNVLGYALICCGLLPQATRVLESVLLEARAVAQGQAELYARFNLAIVAELQGEDRKAATELGVVAEESSRLQLGDLAGWCAIRLAWLDLLRADVEPARDRVAALTPTTAQAPAVEMVHALISYRSGRLRSASQAFRALANDHLARSDELSAFASLLWRALAEDEAGHRTAASRSVEEALTLGQQHAFRLSANWWAPEILGIASKLASAETREYAAQLVPPSRLPTPPAGRWHVELRRDGSITVEGAALRAERWSAGRTGNRVLRRLFAALLAAYPSPLRRDELTDLMWPESEGDSAVANLYAATNDLRTVLADVPGVSLVSRGGTYALVLGPNVVVGES